MTFSQFDAHSSPLFKSLYILKFPDLVTLHTSIFMHKSNNNMLPSAFTNFFTPVNIIHTYNTRLASKSYALTKTRTNYGIFNLRYQGAKVWNSIDEKLNFLPPNQFKIKLKEMFLFKY